ncbi:tellurite resistance TerB family protein [Myroides pelagicus]|uniref:TerB family tellurite resistance protein n=1 Tax=Myroides pelagicus TaxID=270914 RepID=A0A7K1GLE9_9FLAO|nr:TerB family tellurite resistance protein [Myroides pelagicus]MEC4112943.1 TerB family tellurite resistance protein [Myroides pelagicus]MTH29054.1 TerB family tellurite resistance protein [Myroides pelagicus]
MAYSDLFDAGFKDRNRGHFASIVRVALTNGHISEEEKKFIDQLAIRLDISEEDYSKILKNPESYPINPPYLEINRIERLYDLARMVYVDNVLGKKQKDILRKFAVALGFTTNVDYIVDKALSLLVLNADLDTFIDKIKTKK